MKWRYLILFAAITSAHAQSNVTVASVPQDLSNYATTTALNSVSAALPQPCNVVPQPDSLMGSVGSGSCYQRPTDTRPTVVQAAIVTTNSTGAWSVTWSKPFNTANPYINPQPINVTGLQPYICNVTSSTTTTATGQCWQTTTMTLPSVATSLLGLILNPTITAANVSVRVAARDATQ